MKNYGLRFREPAHDWLSAIPLGNGHIGVMMFGDPNHETLCLNDDTLWSGYFRDYSKPDFRENLEHARGLILAGERSQAQELIENRMLGRFTQAYLPFGSIKLGFEQGTYSDYQRSLDFLSGVAKTHCIKNGTVFSSTCFCSFPQDVMVYRVEAHEPFSFCVSLECELEHRVSVTQHNMQISGVAPSDIIVGDVNTFHQEGNIVSYAEREKSTRFFGELRVETDGELTSADCLCVNHCHKATLFFSCATSFARQNPQNDCRKAVEAAVRIGYEKVLETHTADFGQLYNRVAVDFGGSERETIEFFAAAKQGDVDGYGIATLFQYGRYLLISSSRSGTQAANLQGIWNKDVIPPWWSGYTLNINLQMNYWHAQRTNLSECAGPLFDFIERLKANGEETAQKNYGMRGFVSHHQSDIWAQATPVGFTDKRERDSSCYAFWNLSGPWLCLHLYEHYLFTGDFEFLQQRAYPIFKSCAEFLFDYLVDIQGTLTAYPTTSPENMYWSKEGNRLAICSSSAMSIGILTAFFRACEHICSLNGEEQTRARAQELLRQLPAYQVEQGRLLEWDADVRQVDLGHRHFSMLFGAYPSSDLLGEFKEPAENALRHRLENGSASTGWSAVWAIALLARFGDHKEAGRVIRHFMQEHLHENLFGSHPPSYFQIDANFGFTAAISELILQDYDGIIRLVPTLPDVMKSGSVRGLKTQGGHTVSMEWEEYRLKQVTLLAGFGKNVRIAIKDARVSCDEKSVLTIHTDFGVEFVAEEGKLYNISRICE